MLRTALVYDDAFLRHDTGRTHPERPDRLRAIMDALDRQGLNEHLNRLPVEPLDMRWAETVHEAGYLNRLKESCRANLPYIDVPDSGICPESESIARLAAGGTLAAVDAVLAGRVRNAFCAVRPPGHHCEADRSMGFCLMNNIAIAAKYLRQHHQLNRVLILDWDVHHGNGTQHTFEADPSVFFCSLHEHPSFRYPGTGFEWETGEGPGQGTTLNLPMYPGARDDQYKQAFAEQFLPAACKFKPEFILVSAGFDAHADDPLATIDLSTDCFAWMTEQAVKLAEELCGGRIVSVLEGGYHLKALGDCAAAHVVSLMGNSDDS